MEYPSDIDAEIVPLLDALNEIPFVNTMFSCCGHGDRTWYVFMRICDDTVRNLIIQRFTKRSELGFRIHFFKENEIGFYSDTLGNLPGVIRDGYQKWLIAQCGKVTQMYRYSIDNKTDKC